MAIERRETTAGNEAKGMKAHKFLGSLKDALMAAGREDTALPPALPAALPAQCRKRRQDCRSGACEAREPERRRSGSLSAP